MEKINMEQNGRQEKQPSETKTEEREKASAYICNCINMIHLLIK